MMGIFGKSQTQKDIEKCRKQHRRLDAAMHRLIASNPVLASIYADLRAKHDKE